MNGMMGGGGAGPMQGLTAAAPQAAEPEQGQPDLQAAASVLQDAVSQYGPQIIEAIQALLAGGGEAGGPAAGGMPPGMM